MIDKKEFRAGIVAIAGCPNVGKSTLLNCFLKQKISITSKRSNTTRHRILGILNEDCCQYVFVDMPGFNINRSKLLDHAIHKTAISSISGVDLVLLILDRKGWRQEDSVIWQQIQSEQLPVVMVINKIDLLSDKTRLLPVIEDLSKRTGVSDIVPISAAKNENIIDLKSVIANFLPEGEPLFPEGVVTDKNERFRAGELLREQIFRRCGQELPYASAVQIEKYEFEADVLNVHALIWVETSGQKRILIGSKGESIKKIGSNMRRQLEKNLGCKVFVKLWVKTRKNWTADQRFVESFGYTEFD